MKYIYSTLFSATLLFSAAGIQAQVTSKSSTASQEKTVAPAPATEGEAPKTEPMAFDKFFKKNMTVTAGEFPVYQDGSKYFLEVPESALNSDLLIIGDIARGYGSNIAQSSGVIRLSKGTGNNINVTKAVYKEAASPDFNQGIEALVQKSNLVPVSFVMPIEALGKTKGSYILNITRHLLESGELFSFKEVVSLNNSDAARSGVQKVRASQNGVVFSVLRTQTTPGQSYNGSKAVDKAVAFVLDLVIQRLPAAQMKVREADSRIGFGTVNYNDFGKNIYGVRNVKVITKWNIGVKAADQRRYFAGELVVPEKQIKVLIDPATPALFVPYIKKAVQQWNSAFSAAGFKDVLVVATDESDSWLSSGKILIKWGNALKGVVTNAVTDPRTGEILAAKMNIDAIVSDDLLPSYFAKCGFKDPRVMKNLYNPAVRGEMMEWKVAQGLAELLGMVPNFRGSAAYTPKQLRSGAWLKDHGFTSSITDDLQFNYVVQPEDQVDISDLMPRVGAYDKMAIGWAYRVFANSAAEKKMLASLKLSNAELLYLEENKSDPLTSKGDLSSDLLAASELGMKNIQLYYPQMEKLTAAMDDKDEDWSNFKALSKAFQISYQLYTDHVVGYIGGLSMRPLLKGYNDIGVVYTPKKDQQKAMALLNQWFFNGAPSWMQSKRLNQLNSESESAKMGRSTQDALKKFITPEVLNNLIQAEYALGKEAYTVTDLFNDIDHYIFKDFSTTVPVDDYRMLMQTNFVYDLATAVAKNNITGGLTDSNEVLHLYFIRTMEQIGMLGAQHQDASAREHYKVMREKIQRNMNQKTN
ncbi:zinc-dependent metalloprotease [Pedobacter sp. MC2016-24]|uniref:zinc-dependent metalloprotease n=1 Tax=Pedobacter sp. MC2016-24 TaxID=2780090 RepID=UPI00187FE8BD|nr:zinc-dependent metalloprotease [Pedobacter sp. MC2016-24]MBE9599579.1 zinc-dependent metalloprotease [Pedobacter sp. MC2016-24]